MTRYQKMYAGKKVCCTCGHYRQHYGGSQKRYYILFCGHCIFPRNKNRRPDQTCEHWKAIEEEPGSEG